MTKGITQKKAVFLLSACLAVCALVSISLGVSAASANLSHNGGRDTVLEYRLKAGFILNFIRFTKWEGMPENVGEPWTLCTYVQEEFLTILSQLNGKQVGQHALRVYDGRKSDQPDHCNVVFVGDHVDEGKIEYLLSSVKAGVLVIGTGQEFVASGGHISIVPRGGRYGFFLNVGSAEHAGLRFSSKLRALAVGEIASTRDQK